MKLLPTILLAVAMALASSIRDATAKDDATTKLVIPDYPAAKDQYSFALMFERAQFPASEKDSRKEQLQKISQCYQRVIDQYPQDTIYTPRAYLSLADCKAQASQPDDAMKYYQLVLNNYNEDEFLQARALFSIGQVLDSKKQFEAAKTTYKEVLDRHCNSTNSGVRQITKKASVLYFQVHEQPVTTSKWSLRGLFGRKTAEAQ